ncbi:CYFA0S01e10396g1_1 [Cyberlindnera fabianii]|uniref:CYFA0S01e10396g1_1 n=1 Tax=Cyberlindnera fabianii TaxID=36022 RepID=A0A061ARS0_CYBFA|nr:CYFA0S01e10396g1_1 [Cyberlindnera fabianii]
MSKKEKRRSYLRNGSGSPIIPIDATFHSDVNINHQLTVTPSLRTVSDPIEPPTSVQHDKSYHLLSKTSSAIKLLLIGDTGVGKSALIVSYCDDYFTENSTTATVGVDLKVKVVKIDGRLFKAVLWDTAGQERYRNVTPTLYKGTNGVLLTYDVTNMASFEGLYHWVKECYENCDPSRTVLYLVGNKLDREKKVVTKDHVKKFIKFTEENYPLLKICRAFEVSAKYSTLVYGLFDVVLYDLVERRCYFDEQKLRNKRSIDLSTTRDEYQRTTNCCSY